MNRDDREATGCGSPLLNRGLVLGVTTFQPAQQCGMSGTGDKEQAGSPGLTYPEARLAMLKGQEDASRNYKIQDKVAFSSL